MITRLVGKQLAGKVPSEAGLRAAGWSWIGLAALAFSACGRQAEAPPPAPAQPAIERQAPVVFRRGMPRPEPQAEQEVEPSEAAQTPRFEAATLTCQTRPAAISEPLKEAKLMETKTVPDPLQPGISPELRLTVQHGPAVKEIRLHLDIEGQPQELHTQPSTDKDAASHFLESTLTVKLPTMPSATLVRYWIELLGPGDRTQRLPAEGAPASTFVVYVQERPAGCKLTFYELKIDPKDLMRLERNAFGNETVPGVFIADGEVYDHIRVRYRGAWARTWPKKPLKIFFSKERPFQNEHCLNLNSGWRDPALAREYFAYHVFAACGVPASQTRMVRLHVNGRFRGLYVQVQQPDKAFVNSFKLKGASVYKAISKSNQADERDLGSEEAYRRHYEKQTQKQDGYGELQRFCHDLARAPNGLQFFERNLNVQEYINFLAATVLTQNWDGFNKNHYLVYDGQGSRKWLVVPWDLDRTFGDHWNWSFEAARLTAVLGTRQQPGITGWNRLEDRFLAEPSLRARFLDRLKDLLDKEFTEQKLFPMLDQVEAEIAPEAVLDRRRWPAPAPDLHQAIEQVKEFVRHRRAFLLTEIQQLRRGDSFAPSN
jgi:spore coat protein CotH